MKKIILIAAITLLSACSSLPKKVPLEHTVVTQTEYVIKIPPAQLMTLPAKVPHIDVDKAQQSDVAAWALKKEAREIQLENQLKDIAAFFIDQQNLLSAAAKAQNIQQADAVAAQDAQNAADADKKKVNLNAQPTK